MKKHFNVAVFIPHLGCKNDCVFCNQRIITGKEERATAESVKRTIEEYISSMKKSGILGGFSKDRSCAESESKMKTETEIEIAFFGGSFTGLDRDEMIEFLEIADSYTGRGNIVGIRLSTRPDYITEDILDILMRYKVNAIELGVQSMFDDVLSASKRGHDVEDTIRACNLINERKIALTGQMMLGLPESDRERDIDTARQLVNLKIQSSRIYPTVIFRRTQLHDMYEAGRYQPISVDEAVYRAKEIKKIFDASGIKILRMGLCASDDINFGGGFFVAGPYHPSFGELVESEIIFDRLCSEIESVFAESKDRSVDIKDIKIGIAADKRDISKIVGHRKKNIMRLKKRFGVNSIEVSAAKIEGEIEEKYQNESKKESVAWVCSIN